MTRRERLERKIEKRREWADKAEARATQAHDTSVKMMSVIPMGQPILVGHHSEKRDRNYRNRAWNLMGKSVENTKLAEHHESKAANLEAALERTIFSDDENAIDAIQHRIAENEAERDRMKLINKLYKKGDHAGLAALGLDLEQLKAQLAAAGSYWGSAPYLPYSLTNLGARIRDDKKRIGTIQARQARTAEAAKAEGGYTLKQNADYAQLTFAEKPEREILDALRAAGFHWSNGSWFGQTKNLPEQFRKESNATES